MAEWVVNWAWFLMIVCWKESRLVGEEWCRLLLSSYVVEVTFAVWRAIIRLTFSSFIF